MAVVTAVKADAKWQHHR